MEAEASAGGEREVVFLQVDADDSAGARVEVLAQIANEPAGFTYGPDVLPFGFTDLPTCLGHGLGQGDDAAEHSLARFFDLDHATGEGVVQAFPATFERLVRADEKEEEIQLETTRASTRAGLILCRHVGQGRGAGADGVDAFKEVGDGVPFTSHKRLVGVWGDADGEVHVGDGEFFLGEVEGQECGGVGLDEFGDGADVLTAHHDAGHAEGDGISKENLGEAFGDDGADAEAVERLRGVFAGAAAAKVRAGEQNAGAGEAGVVERVGLPLGLGKGAGVVEGEFAEPVKSDALHEAGGDDAVGVEVVAGHIDAASADLGDFFESHGFLKKWSV